MKWISVKDELPKKDGDYLVCDTHSDAMMVTCYEVNTMRWNDNGTKPLIDFWEHDEVTHWMPLPNPPSTKK
jgi:hypothetical protein